MKRKKIEVSKEHANEVTFMEAAKLSYRKFCDYSESELRLINRLKRNIKIAAEKCGENIQTLKEYSEMHGSKFYVMDDHLECPNGVKHSTFFDNVILQHVIYCQVKKIPLVVMNSFWNWRVKEFMIRINKGRHLSQRINIPIFYMFE